MRPVLLERLVVGLPALILWCRRVLRLEERHLLEQDWPFLDPCSHRFPGQQV
jgi:hypothetical protein